MEDSKVLANIDWSSALKEAPDYKPRPHGPTGSQAKEANRPIDILDAWTVIEALSPRSYKEPKDLAPSPQDHVLCWEGFEPWSEDLALPKGKTAYYQIHLGAINQQPACEELLKKYHDPRAEEPRLSGRATMGIITVDENGVPADANDLVLSSFGWALGRALKGELQNLRHWDFAEELLKEGLQKIIFKQDEEGAFRPLTEKVITAAHNWLVDACEIPSNLSQAPNFYIKMVRKFDNKAPEPKLFNSFFLKDLQRTRRLVNDGKAGTALRKYLHIDGAPTQKRLDKDKSLLIDGLHPNKFPSGRWPVEGLYPLVLMQQLAVNLAKQELSASGILSVNGPPGTGKTTLLKDVVAHVVIERAKAMAEFKNPKDAFKSTDGELPGFPKATPLYELDPSLKGFEIVVACSNNGAAENLSKELPRKDQIDHQTKPPTYFKTASDALVGDGIETWGLIAAAFGKKKNIKKYRDIAWKDKDGGIKSYLKEPSHYKERFKKKDPDTGEEYEEIPRIVEQDDAPTSFAEANERWKAAKKDFEEKLQKADRLQEIASDALVVIRSYKGSLLKKAKLTEHLEQVKQQCAHAGDKLDVAQAHYEEAEQEAAIVNEHVRLANATKPGWFFRFFRTRRWRNWLSERGGILNQLTAAQNNLQSTRGIFHQARKEHATAEYGVTKSSEQLSKMVSDLDTLKTKIEKASPIFGDHLILEDQLSLSKEELHKKSPTFTADAHLHRDALFRSALRLHKAFIDAASIQFNHGLTAFFNHQDGEPLPQKYGHLLPDLWSILFMVTPVISSTFASFGRMFQNMPPESLGWLLVDEAGQSTPQAAVGALMRSKRAMIVGDPLQLEPVVNLPEELVDTLSRHFSVKPTRWMAPFTSVQGLSDEATTYCSKIGETKVGVPLLVHRRCDHPMFDMSNALSYENQMVFAANGRSEKSSWYNVIGTDKDKWCPEEGEAAWTLVRDLLEADGSDANVFVISPFRNVVHGLERRFKSERHFFMSKGIKMKDWLDDNVGTIHTFQGKEAATVIVVLGAQGPKRNGARSWVTGQPNLLNVAVSRAKKTLYVIGNHRDWASSGFMSEVSSRIRTSDKFIENLENA